MSESRPATESGPAPEPRRASGSSPAPDGAPPELPFPHFQRWGRAAIVPIVLMAPLMLFVFDYLSADLYTLEFVSIELPVSDTEIFLNHLRLSAVGVTAAILGGLGAAFWLVWQYRMHANVRALGVEGQRFRPWAAVAVWFVPAANLVLPALAFAELWRASNPYAERGDWKQGRASPLVWLWWALFLASAGFALRGLVQGLGASSAQDLIARDHTWQIAAALAIPTSVLTGILIALVNRRLILAEDRVRFPGFRAWSDRDPRAVSG